MDNLPLSMLDGAGTVTLALIVFLMIARGTLVTRREADGIRKDRDDWHSAYNAVEGARHVESAQVGELIEHARTTNALIRGLSEVAANRETP